MGAGFKSMRRCCLCFVAMPLLSLEHAVNQLPCSPENDGSTENQKVVEKKYDKYEKTKGILGTTLLWVKIAQYVWHVCAAFFLEPCHSRMGMLGPFFPFFFRIGQLRNHPMFVIPVRTVTYVFCHIPLFLLTYSHIPGMCFAIYRCFCCVRLHPWNF